MVVSDQRELDGRWLIVHGNISVPAESATGKAVMDFEA